MEDEQVTTLMTSYDRVLRDHERICNVLGVL